MFNVHVNKVIIIIRHLTTNINFIFSVESLFIVLGPNYYNV